MVLLLVAYGQKEICVKSNVRKDSILLMTFQMSIPVLPILVNGSQGVLYQIAQVRHTFYIRTLSYDVASGSEITPCNKICKPLVVYRFSGNVMTSITSLRS